VPAAIILPPSSHLATNYLYPPSADPASKAHTILASQRADLERIHQEKVAAEKKLQELLCLVDHFRLDVKQAERQFLEAERRIGETRARMRANGLTPSTGIRM
jgi:predicted  nucleic acid-binding Zn-ribbon protein